MPITVFGGKLDDFEADVSNGYEGNEYRSHHSDDGEDLVGSCLSDVASGCLVDLFSGTIAYSIDAGKTFGDDVGDAHIPFFRLDLSYQDVESDVDAFGYRLEFGYRFLGAQFRQIHYKENTPEDDLDIREGHLLLRIAGDPLEVNFGFGGMSVEGHQSHSGLSLTLPLILQLPNEFDVELRPSWAFINGSDIQHYELAALYGWQYFSFRAGYRWLRAESESLDGPFLGVSLRY